MERPDDAVKRRRAFDAKSLRRTGSTPDFPWLDRLVTLVRVDGGGAVTQARGTAGKRAVLGAAADEDLVLAAWPGEWGQDVFVVDDLAAARLAVGLPRRRVQRESTDDRPPRGTAPAESRTLWSCLAALPDLPVEGQRQVARTLATTWSTGTTSSFLGRPDLDPGVRRQFFAQADAWQAPALVANPHSTAAEAGELLDRFPGSAGVVEAALLRDDTREAALRVVAGLSYTGAADMWLGGTAWRAPKRPELAEAIMSVVLGAEPADVPTGDGYAAQRYERSALIRSLAADLPAGRRLELLRDPRHGPLAQRAFLAGDVMSDDELVECLPEVTRSAEDASALVAHVRRFPRLVELARDRLGAAAARLVAGGWSPEHAARAGQWDVLIAVARIATTPDVLEALVNAALLGSGTTHQERHRWHDARRYHLVDLLVGNPASSDRQVHRLLDRLPDEDVEDIGLSAPRRGRLDRLCAEALRDRRSAAGATTDLPTEEALASADDPASVLAALLRRRGPDREAAVRHALDSEHMTDDLAWRLPVGDLQDHPRYGPRLAAEIARVCGASPRRWQSFADAWNGHTRLLATTLFTRLRAVDD